AHAVTVHSYDIGNAQLSGAGGWAHTYSGLIVGNNYSGGGGTLNDGIVPVDEFNNQLFWLPDSPTVTLHLSALSYVSAIQLLGGVLPSNSVPGTLTGWSVTIGGSTRTLTSTAYGPVCGSGLCNDSVSLIGTGLDVIATSSVILSSFWGSHVGGLFNIGEATVTASPVPESGTYAMLLTGLAVLAFMARRRVGVRSCLLPSLRWRSTCRQASAAAVE
ncbi:MAG: PEP-CTERM sorting domain-containing protein, partial [Rubrivivax sp.]|nr:PEP-CTERM sorting domain-containing protein [Rubrivivax sp.]